jgi:hypothetical protein
MLVARLNSLLLDLNSSMTFDMTFRNSEVLRAIKYEIAVIGAGLWA